MTDRPEPLFDDAPSFERLRHRLAGSPFAPVEQPLGLPLAVLELPYLPTSFNRTAHAHWARVRREKQQLQHDLAVLLIAQWPRPQRPLPGRVIADAVLLVPDRRRRDEGNYRTPIEKALGDALVAGRWMLDDTPAHYSFGALRFEHRPGVRATRIRLAVEGA